MSEPKRIITVRFVLLFTVTFGIFLAVGVAQPLIPRLVRDGLGGDDRDVGLMATVYAIASIFSRPLLSWVARRGPRALMIGGAFVTLVGFAIHLRVESLFVLASGRAVAAVGESMVWVGYATYVTGLAPKGRQAEAISLSTVAVFAGLGIGPLIGDPLARAGRFDSAVLWCIAGLALAVALAFLIRRSWYEMPEVRKTGMLTWRELLHPAAIPIGLVLALAMIGWSGWNSFVALHADAIGMRSVAPLFAMYAVLALGFRLVLAKVPELVGLGRCAAGSLSVMAVGLMILAVWPSPLAVYAGTAVIALGMGLMYPSLSGLALRAAPSPAERADVLGSFGMFFEVGTGIGGFALGAVSDRSGEQAAFGVGALVMLTGLGLLLWRLGREAQLLTRRSQITASPRL